LVERCPGFNFQKEILFLPPEEAKLLRILEPSLRKLSGVLDWEQQRALEKAATILGSNEASAIRRRAKERQLR
jgi:hypothetical protein